MDFKRAITDAIDKLIEAAKSSGNEELAEDWRALKEDVRADDNQSRLFLKWQTLREVLVSGTADDATGQEDDSSFTVATPVGKKTFKSLSDLDKWTQEHLR